jgi:hypothetical protein
MAEGHTDSFDICAMLQEEFHNVDLAVARSHMQCSGVALIYHSVGNERNLKDGVRKYQ